MSVQTTISFPMKKKVLHRSCKKDGKENQKDVADVSNTLATRSPARTEKRKNLIENNGDCSPPKLNKNNLSPSKLLTELNLEEKSCGQDEDVELVREPIRLYGREDKIERICGILRECEEEGKSGTVYISGPPGTGKTACLSHIVAHTQVCQQYQVVYVNCTGVRSSAAVYKNIAEGLSIKVPPPKTEKKCLSAIETYLRSPHKIILLILDEMDQLESKRQAVLYTLFEWGSRPELRIVLVGVANALDLTDRVLPRLQARLELQPTLVHFPPYTREQIVHILHHRLQQSGVGRVLGGAALQLLASKVAAVSGDIRRALHLARRLIQSKVTHLPDEGQQGEVSAQEVVSVVNSVYGTSGSLAHPVTETGSSQSEDSFPLQQKILICCLVLIKNNISSKLKEINVGKLHDVYRKVCSKRNLSSLDMSEFLSLAELVESRGVIKVHGKTKNRHSKITLQWDESEIKVALQDKHLLGSILNDVSSLN